MSNPIKETLLGRGWAGKTLSRSETAERINALMHKHVDLNHYYRAAIRSVGDDRVVDVLERLLKTSRTDLGKLSETVLSAGGDPYNGTDVTPEEYELAGDTASDILRQLTDIESDFTDAVAHELDLEHQMRTRGVLEAVKSNSTDRLNALNALVRRADEIGA